MAKRVHFADRNTVFKSPSPQLSDATLSDVSELSTPPPELASSPAAHAPQHLVPWFLHISPPPHQELPKATDDMQIHCALAFAFFQGRLLSANFDLTFPYADQIRLHLQAHELAEAATKPPLPQLFIKCPELFPWTITVEPSLPGSHVTVEDVFRTLYRELRPSVSPNEYEALTHTRKLAVGKAYHERCQRIADHQLQAREQSRGIRKVDFLQDMIIFKGLSLHTDRNHWELHVGPLSTTPIPYPVTLSMPGLSPSMTSV
ncbi:hypothetical protein AGABI1DRAFT_64678 [Agaricus bisporus var. burnettii JB137-S8]|uniref:DUF6699 domain-containing protein n=1 Tax=Agaricus bisporus var. burnettii (strain JB137-S8 / ATCC MYA-4627 / FGSC 10392) TaxID=597362 RepID=K5WXK6_AGABU|nr:uncharacterized protein AGABI1DRAFT_64678 [Agaricus bisporus var. burnettii JB137-S8]EKM75317.1 hypothetical protein AGABI1DRAFT_64678 [Agaricus bisporus var. burnettii JB137-S8]